MGFPDPVGALGKQMRSVKWPKAPKSKKGETIVIPVADKAAAAHARAKKKNPRP